MSPATGELVDSVANRGPAEVNAAVDRVRKAQPQWEASGFKARHEALDRLSQFLLDNEDELMQRIVAETGKVRMEAANEIIHIADTVSYYGENAPKFLAEERIRPHSPVMRTKALKVVYRPQPVVGLIGPWNFPIILTLGDAVPALMAGSAVVIKPSEFTPLTLRWIGEIWQGRLGLPPIFEVVTGAGETGAALIDAVDFVGFTGSVATGRKVAARAAETLTPFSLELGGKDPMLVLADANIDRAAAGAAWGGLSNSGQICMSVERIYVEEPVYDEFVERLVENVSRLRQGRDSDTAWHDIGAMTTPLQIEKVEEHVREAVERGAKVLAGGRRNPDQPGDFYEPTVLVDVDHTMKVMREETFGPVLPIMMVRDEEEAIRMANDSPYGLSASVWGKDKYHAESVARRIEAGSCNVNDVLVNYLTSDVPFGGWKESGIGYRHGPGGIRKYCRTESLVITRAALGKREPLWFPYSKRKLSVFGRVGRLLYAKGLRNKLRWRRD